MRLLDKLIPFLISALIIVACTPKYGPALLGADLPYMEMPVYENRPVAEFYISASATSSSLDVSLDGGNDTYEMSIHNGVALKDINLGMSFFGYAGEAKDITVSSNILHNPPDLTTNKNYYGYGCRGQLNYSLYLNRITIKDWREGFLHA